MKTIARWIALGFLNLCDLIYQNKPEGEKYTKADRERMREIREMRKKFNR